MTGGGPGCFLELVSPRHSQPSASQLSTSLRTRYHGIGGTPAWEGVAPVRETNFSLLVVRSGATILALGGSEEEEELAFPERLACAEQRLT